MKVLWLFCAAIASANLCACDKSDLGTPCPPPASNAPSQPASQPAGGNEIDYSDSFYHNSICDSFICASSETRANYCTQTCFSQSQCPDGSVCATLQPVGPFANTQYCLLRKVCNSNSDCPKGGWYCNKNVPTSTPGAYLQYCDVTR